MKPLNLYETVSNDNNKNSVSLAHRAEYYALRGVIGGLHAVPWHIAAKVGEQLGALGYRPFGIRKRVVERQIAAAFPEWSMDDVHTVARKAYKHLGRSTVETALLPSLKREQILDLVESTERFELIEEAITAGTGAVLITGHLGNWELAGAYVAARGIPLDAIVRGQSNPLFDTYLNQTRAAIGMTVVRDHEAVRRTPRSLREGRAVAFVADQGVLGLASTYVPFFGRPAKTPRGAAVFALKYKVPTLFVAVIRQPSGRYRLSVEPIPVEETGDRDRDIDTIVARYTAILEGWVRTAPEQYFWHHRRWRRQPPDTPPELRDPTA
jgi:KDO2-lipid IV(A) lauroyltransferase